MTHIQYNETVQVRRFLDWLQAGGATLPSVEIRAVNGLRGIYATRKIFKGELIFHIPRHLIVTTELAENSPIGLRITALDKPATCISYMTAFLLQNRREEGFWFPHIAIMPSNFSSLIAFHRHSHRTLLKGCISIWQPNEPTDLPPAIAVKNEILNEYRIIRPLFENLDLREYLMMYHLIVNRMFKIDMDGYSTNAVIPFADMPNHAAPPQAQWCEFASQGFFSTALQDIECGTHVTIGYGIKSNGELLVSHGFCIENNRYNWLKIALPDIKPRHPFFEKTKTWGERRGRSRLFTVSLNHEALSARKMFSYLRIACLEDMPALRFALTSMMDDEILPEVSRQNECIALAALSVACERGLNLFDRTLEEDQELLTDPGLDWLERCAIMVGQGEKRILKHYIDLVNDRLAAISPAT